MLLEVLTTEQDRLIPLIKRFNKKFYLVGGTAIALQLGHRRSIDFDLFNEDKLNRKSIRGKIQRSNFKINRIYAETTTEFTMIINKVKVTFYQYPFQIPHDYTFKDIISMPTLLDLIAMKAYALGRRAKWKDYVDLYFTLKDKFSLLEINKRANELFGNLFSEKLFRQQLSYFDDIDSSEEVEFIGEEIPKNKIKDFLTEVAVIPF